MKTIVESDNIYVKEEILYIDRSTMKPTKMEIQDDKQKTRIYILYNEVEINM